MAQQTQLGNSDKSLGAARARTFVEQKEDRDQLRMLLDVTNAMMSNLDLQGVFKSIASSLHRVLGHKRTTLALYDEQGGDLVPFAIEVHSGEILALPPTPPPNAPPLRAIQARRTMVFKETDLADPAAEVIRAAGILEYCSVPLVVRERVLGTFDVGSTEPGAFGSAAVAMVEAVARQMAIAVDNALAFQKIEQLNGQLGVKYSYPENEIRSEHNFDAIVGDSGALRQVLKEVEVVALTDSTVLVLGETGTGKELIARAIHDHSRRRDRTFIKINCAAIPGGLLESELFGHEKGAFTGAIGQKFGRFEVASGGTLFLDEVGDIPLELQAKLLRVLQEQEFERIGGNKTIKVDVRLIAATNRDLAAMVEQHTFRADLYYRLNVFPIRVPPLRERSEDIPALVRYFTQEFASRMHKRLDQVAPQTIARLKAHPWPGNVRELANLIERAAILSRGTVLEVPLAEVNRLVNAKPVERAAPPGAEPDQSRILEALCESQWVLGGPRGAAARLGMKRTTLQSRLPKLGITRPTRPRTQTIEEDQRPNASAWYEFYTLSPPFSWITGSEKLV
jgi:formate hydrogenlyase transcriptional activator